MKISKISDKRVWKAVFLTMVIMTLFSIGVISAILDIMFWAYFNMIVAGLSVYGLALEYFGFKWKNTKERDIEKVWKKGVMNEFNGFYHENEKTMDDIYKYMLGEKENE